MIDDINLFLVAIVGGYCSMHTYLLVHKGYLVHTAQQHIQSQLLPFTVSQAVRATRTQDPRYVMVTGMVMKSKFHAGLHKGKYAEQSIRGRDKFDKDLIRA